MYKFRTLPVIVVVALFLFSCKGAPKQATESPTTGWSYKDPKSNDVNDLGYPIGESSEQITGPNLVLIEGGTFTMGRVDQDVMFDWNNQPRRVTVSSFYMDETEVTNLDYREYLYWLKRVYRDYPEVHRRALPDTLVWRSPLGFNEPYVNYYFRHPSYNTYPVVGVSWLQASDYCVWRSDRVNEMILVDSKWQEQNIEQTGANNFNTESYLQGQYEGIPGERVDEQHPRVRQEDGILLPRYRLPTEAEWEFASYGLKGNTFEERIYERALYPWDGPTVRNSAAKYRGEFMANFVRGRGDMMGVAGSLNDAGSITVDVRSYWPNDYGLYCMAGNVNEWTQDVYRPLSSEDVDGFNPFRGNVFTDLRRDANGQVVEKDRLGRLVIDTVKADDVANRYNYQKSDYRNYLDGDVISSISSSEEWSGNAELPQTERMYSQNTTDNDYVTLISDKARVIKGGSWKDRAYWLNPSARRFLEQESSRDDLGFRCAMIRVGSPSGF